MNDVRLEIDEALTAAAPAVESQTLSESPALAVVATFVVLASAAMVAVFFKDLIPPLVTMYNDLALALEPAFGIYIRASNIGGMIVIMLALVVLVVVVAGRRVPIARRRTLLIGAMIASSAWTSLGLYFVARHGVVHAMRLHLGLKTALIQADLASLDLADAQPADAIAVTDPGNAREQFDGRSALAFQLGEAYRQRGDLATARALYRRAQALAARFDEQTSQAILATEERWEKNEGLGAAGIGVAKWGPSVSDVRRLPAMIRAAAERRLDQIGR